MLRKGRKPYRSRRRHLSDSLNFQSASPRSKLYVQSSDRSGQAFVARRCVPSSAWLKHRCVSTGKCDEHRKSEVDCLASSHRPPGARQCPVPDDCGQSNTLGGNYKVRHPVHDFRRHYSPVECSIEAFAAERSRQRRITLPSIRRDHGSAQSGLRRSVTAVKKNVPPAPQHDDNAACHQPTKPRPEGHARMHDLQLTASRLGYPGSECQKNLRTQQWPE